MEADEELLDEEDNFDGEDSPVLEIVILPTQVSPLLTHFRMKNQRSQTIIGTKVKKFSHNKLLTITLERVASPMRTTEHATQSTWRLPDGTSVSLTDLAQKSR